MSTSDSGKPEWRTTANLITIVRILLIPVFIVALLAPWPEWFYDPSMALQDSSLVSMDIKPWVAAIIYAILAFTDGIDGYVARKRNEVTTVGKFLDPLADKILVAAALLALVELGDLPSWVVLIIIAREFIVSGFRMLAATRGVVISARMSGKIKTALTFVAIILFILKRTPQVLALSEEAYRVVYIVSWSVMIAALVMTIVSLIVYYQQTVEIMRKPVSDTPIGDASEKSALDGDISEAAKRVIGLANSKGFHIATAESCTGGLIGAALTGVAGSSESFDGGIISYSNDVKMSELGVKADTLQQYGAVSEQTACQMAEGARDALLGDYKDGERIAVSVTGVAGPGGGSAEKPVGTVWFGVSGCGPAKAHVCHFEGERSSVRAQTVREALRIVEERLNGDGQSQDGAPS